MPLGVYAQLLAGGLSTGSIYALVGLGLMLAFKGTGLQLPYGAHLRLRASFDISKFGPQSRVIARAMKTYGIYLADTDRSDNALYDALALDGSNPWNARDLASLSSIHISDFDVLKLDRIQSVR